MKRTARDSEESNQRLNRRTLMLGGAMGAMIAVLGVRMRYLQVDQADEFKLLAEENRINIRLIPPERGLIQDRNGKIIAGNEQNYRVVITREAAGDVYVVMRRLATIMPMTAGCRPLNTAVTIVASLTRRKNCAASSMSRAGGRKMPTVDSRAPGSPAILYPMKAALMRIGPGVNCPIAMPSANSCVLSQPS